VINYVNKIHNFDKSSSGYIYYNLLLIYNLIPVELSSFFYNYIGNQKSRNKYFLEFISELILDININIWKHHRQSNLQWESSHNITVKSKRNYRKNLKQTTPADNADSSTPLQTDAPTSRRRKRRRHTHDSTSLATHTQRLDHHITSRPYYKKDSLITQNQHIR
jgi:hypothetical protein